MHVYPKKIVKRMIMSRIFFLKHAKCYTVMVWRDQREDGSPDKAEIPLLYCITALCRYRKIGAGRCMLAKYFPQLCTTPHLPKHPYPKYLMRCYKRLSPAQTCAWYQYLKRPPSPQFGLLVRVALTSTDATDRFAFLLVHSRVAFLFR